MWRGCFAALLFGILEGVTEWLPVSSTGHMILLDELVSLKVSTEFYEMFQVVIQLGAILAVILLFFHKLNPFSPKKDCISGNPIKPQLAKTNEYSAIFFSSMFLFLKTVK